MKPPALRNAKPANIPMLMFAGIGGSITVVATYKFWIRPYLEKQRRREAELVANAIFDSQMRRTGQVDATE